MIIDADCHISPTPEGGNSIGADELLRRMDSCGVQMALTWLQPPYRRETAPANLYVYESMVRYPDRILGFGWADPKLGVDHARDTVKRCVYDYGFFGVKLNGAENGFYIDDAKLAMPVIEEIARTGKVLAFHTGSDGPDMANPFRVGRIAALYPELPILMVHMGGVGLPDLTQAAMDVAREHSNVTLIASAVRGPAVLRAIAQLGAQRVCFGSDTPFEVMRAEVARFAALLNGAVSDADTSGIMGGNIARLLGLGIQVRPSDTQAPSAPRTT